LEKFKDSLTKYSQALANDNKYQDLVEIGRQLIHFKLNSNNIIEQMTTNYRRPS
jgi:hypothetical protein